MDVHAKARYIRISPRKVRLVLDAVRGMRAEEAVIKLSLLPQKSARPVKKLLESAIANAENNFKLQRASLRIKHLVADEGPTIKRWQPRAYGRAAMIRKRTSHISIILTDGKESVTAEKATKDTKKEAVPEKKATKKTVTPKKQTTNSKKKTATVAKKKETKKTTNSTKKSTKKS